MTPNSQMSLKKLTQFLSEQGLTVSVAESCTGGMVGAALTSEAGSSVYFTGGVLAYDNRVKTDVLGVSHETLLSYGAVSEEVVSEMALGVRRLLNTDWAIATTGIAGPGGGSEEKPVGTVWIGLADREGVFSRLLQAEGDRAAVRAATVEAALAMCLETLTAEDDPL